MDVDEDEGNTQQIKELDDYGIEVDFDMLSPEDREVRLLKKTYG